MPSFSDSLFLFVLALLLFGPKKLPVLARELGKWIGEFRRASNEFKMQMEEELRQSEQADRQKQITAMEAAAPVPPPLEPEPVHPHLRDDVDYTAAAEPDTTSALPAEPAEPTVPEAPVTPLPIATSGSLNLMPPSTGLPVPRSRGPSADASNDPLCGLLDAIPAAPESGSRLVDTHAEVEETAAHGR